MSYHVNARLGRKAEFGFERFGAYRLRVWWVDDRRTPWHIADIVRGQFRRLHVACWPRRPDAARELDLLQSEAALEALRRDLIGPNAERQEDPHDPQ